MNLSDHQGKRLLAGLSTNDIFERITPQVVQDFAEHGVVLLRRVIAPAWIEKLRIGIEKNIAEPTARGRIWDRDDNGRVCFYDSQAWQRIAEYRKFVEQSPIAEIAARVMNSDRVNFFFDAVFVRTPGAQFRTPFHQDEPYWSVEGFDTCTIWMPLVPVEKESALEFVRGSHRWNRCFRQTDFGALTGDERDQRIDSPDDQYELFPDIEGDRGKYEILSWDMLPGDCTIFNGRVIHGGSGNLSRDRDLKVFSTKWLGDDVRICFRKEGMDPDHSQIMTQLGLKSGDRIGSALYPEFRFELA
ncbi:phytanoyl-CoA dioxygenase family protein [Candidatus Spongiihabitans sp.]|uniref:phytanoyl-CoA dioxygenase family protein n=1 Tax=Candidatus Spongiihabitans sp. TaxID=3101308 RepID=UPI003C6F679E